MLSLIRGRSISLAYRGKQDISPIICRMNKYLVFLVLILLYLSSLFVKKKRKKVQDGEWSQTFENMMLSYSFCEHQWSYFLKKKCWWNILMTTNTLGDLYFDKTWPQPQNCMQPLCVSCACKCCWKLCRLELFQCEMQHLNSVGDCRTSRL